MRGGVEGRGVRDARYGGGVFGNARLGLSPGRRLILVAQESFLGGALPGMTMVMKMAVRSKLLGRSLKLRCGSSKNEASVRDGERRPRNFGKSSKGCLKTCANARKSRQIRARY